MQLAVRREAKGFARSETNGQPSSSSAGSMLSTYIWIHTAENAVGCTKSGEAVLCREWRFDDSIAD